MLPDSISSHLDAALGGIGGAFVADPGAGLRWTPRKQRHLTLAFHGNVPDGSVSGYLDALAWALSDAALEPFPVSLAGGGSFSGRTLWAGVGEGARQLQKLSGIVSEAAAEAGFWPDSNAGGRPHVTLARASVHRGEQHRRGNRRGGRRGGFELDGTDAGLANLEAWARALAIYRGPMWSVDTVSVVRSELGKGPGSSPLYSVLSALPLGAGRADSGEKWADFDGVWVNSDDGWASSDDAGMFPVSAGQAGARLPYRLRMPDV